MSTQQPAVIHGPSERQVNFLVCLTAATAALAGLLFSLDPRSDGPAAHIAFNSAGRRGPGRRRLAPVCVVG